MNNACSKAIQAQNEARKEMIDGKESIWLDIMAQHNTISDITAQTIKTCCEDIDNKFVERGTEIVTNITKRLKDDDQERIEIQSNHCKKMEKEMKAVHTQLVATNRIVIKNNSILQEKLIKAENKVGQFMK